MLSFLHKYDNNMAVWEVTTTVNDLKDAHDNHTEKQKWIKDKIANIEDRSRCNNVTICGIQKSVPPLELHSFVRSLNKAVLPDLKNITLVIDRVHMLPKPLFLPETVP